MIALYVTLAVVFFVALAEWLHARRCRRLASLSYGPNREPRTWVYIAPFLRIAACGGLCWGLITLLLLDPKVHNQGKLDDNDYKHLVLVLDVSPSMYLDDAGPELKESRRNRASSILESLFNRIPIRQYRLSVIAVYSQAKPVVVDSLDVEVVRHILEKMPMYHGFKPGKTDLFAGLRQAGAIARRWNPKSTIVVIMTDGDTVPPKGMPRMPASVKDVLIVGVGDPNTGKFIDGHQSRQDISTLRQIANRLGGIYHNGNQKHLTSQTISFLTQSDDDEAFEKLTLREIALICVTIGSAILALLPLALHWFGSGWRPGVRASANSNASAMAGEDTVAA